MLRDALLRNAPQHEAKMERLPELKITPARVATRDSKLWARVTLNFTRAAACYRLLVVQSVNKDRPASYARQRSNDGTNTIKQQAKQEG